MHEKAKFMQGYGRLVKISTGCVDESCVMEGVEEADGEDAGCVDAEEADGVVVKNKFRELQMGAVDDDEEEDIAAVNYEANDGVVSATVDSGAARSVWPRRKGVLRRKLGQEAQARSGERDEDRSVRRSRFTVRREREALRDEVSGQRREETFGGGQCHEQRGERRRVQQEVGELHRE